MARFQSFWFGDRLGPCQELCLKSFIDHGHEFDLYSYAQVRVPTGVRLRDASEILPRDEVFFYPRGKGAGSPACFANLFRYRLLLERGGWWVDMDVVCLSPRTPEGELFFEWQDQQLIAIGALKFPPSHPFIIALYGRCRAAGKDLVWAQTGPKLITALAKEMGLANRANPTGSVYPIHYSEAFLPVTKAGRAATYEKTRDAPFLHLWNEIFRRKWSIALHNPPNGSFLADLYKKHGVRRRYWALIDPYSILKWGVEPWRWIEGLRSRSGKLWPRPAR